MEKILEVDKKNCGKVLKDLRQMYGVMSLEDLAKILGVSRSTLYRIEEGQTLPSEEFLNRLKALQIIGISKFQTLSEKEKTKASEQLKELGISDEVDFDILKEQMLKTLTPVGIITGLSALGSASLGAAAASAAVTLPVATLPIGAGLVGYGIFKGLKSIIDANKLTCTEIDGRFEIVKKIQED